MSKFRELQKRRERYGLLRDWYGKEFAENEIVAHNAQPHLLADGLNNVLQAMRSPEVGIFVRIEKDWEKLVGRQWARFTHPSELTDGVLTLEVPHSALIPELTPSLDLILARLHQQLGAECCREIRLTISGSRRRQPLGGSR